MMNTEIHITIKKWGTSDECKAMHGLTIMWILHPVAIPNPDRWKSIMGYWGFHRSGITYNTVDGVNMDYLLLQMEKRKK